MLHLYCYLLVSLRARLPALVLQQTLLSTCGNHDSSSDNNQLVSVVVFIGNLQHVSSAHLLYLLLPCMQLLLVSAGERHLLHTCCTCYSRACSSCWCACWCACWRKAPAAHLLHLLLPCMQLLLVCLLEKGICWPPAAPATTVHAAPAGVPAGERHLLHTCCSCYYRA